MAFRQESANLWDLTVQNQLFSCSELFLISLELLIPAIFHILADQFQLLPISTQYNNEYS